MKEISELTACVIDHGLFLPLAERLAKEYERVLYWSPYEEGFSTIKKACFGDGYRDIERCVDPWKQKNEIDLFIFPDVEHSGMQLELVDQGFPVWGSRNGDELELDREQFIAVLEETGLEVFPHKIVVGITALREHLRGEEDKYIKTSRWRGDFETAHWRDWDRDHSLLDVWSLQFGPTAELVRFIVCDPIETDLEIGGDMYSVNGEFPGLMLNGIEYKDKAYFAAVTKRDAMPEQIRQVMEGFSPVLAQYQYRNQFSCELRVKGDRFWFTDFTARGGLPSTPSQLELWANWGEIIWSGAHGVLVDPEPVAQFSMECVLTTKWEHGAWAAVKFPDSLEDSVKPYRSCVVDGLHCFPPNEYGEELGWLVATGDTPRATLEAMQEKVKELPDGVCAHMESLVDVIKEIESAQKQGIPFTKKPLPEPAEVVEG